MMKFKVKKPVFRGGSVPIELDALLTPSKLNLNSKSDIYSNKLITPNETAFFEKVFNIPGVAYIYADMYTMRIGTAEYFNQSAVIDNVCKFLADNFIEGTPSRKNKMSFFDGAFVTVLCCIGVFIVASFI